MIRLIVTILVTAKILNGKKRQLQTTQTIINYITLNDTDLRTHWHTQKDTHRHTQKDTDRDIYAHIMPHTHNYTYTHNKLIYTMKNIYIKNLTIHIFT